MGSVWDIGAAEWDAVMATNLRSVFFGCRMAGLRMRARGNGRIINMASIAGQRGGTATGAHYAASKAGVLVLTKVFAQELAGSGVTVNAIAAAAIAGPMVDAVEPQKRAALERSIPVGRFGHGEEVAAAALYLASRRRFLRHRRDARRQRRSADAIAGHGCPPPNERGVGVQSGRLAPSCAPLGGYHDNPGSWGGGVEGALGGLSWRWRFWLADFTLGRLSGAKGEVTPFVVASCSEFWRDRLLGPA